MDLSKEDSPFKKGERIHPWGWITLQKGESNHPFEGWMVDKGELKKGEWTGESLFLRLNEKRLKSGIKNES